MLVTSHTDLELYGFDGLGNEANIIVDETKAPECILCVNLLQSNHALNEIASLICEGKPWKWGYWWMSVTIQVYIRKYKWLHLSWYYFQNCKSK